MKRSFLKYLSYFLVLAAIIVPLFLIFSLFDTESKNQILLFSQKNTWAIPLLILFFKAVGIIFPPVNGGFVVYSTVPYYNWFLVFIFDLFGSVIGSSIAFYLSRKYREKILFNFLTIKKITEWEKRIFKNNSFYHFLFLRFITAPISDLISYLAGLTNISFKNYFFASLIASSTAQLLIIYFLNRGVELSIIYLIPVLLAFILSYIIYRRFIE